MGDPAGRIFLSYRRDDTKHMAGRLADRLDLRFGSGTVFMDVDAIAPGADFTSTIATEVSSCDLLIALIGKDYLALDERTGQPRLHEDNDFVAIEIKAALDRGIYVIPVLVDEAKMPTVAELPASLQPLARRHATRLDHETFPSDVERFLTAVERILRTVATERTARHRQHAPPTQTSHRPDRPRPHVEAQQVDPGQPVAGFLGVRGSDMRLPDNPNSISGPRIPPIRVALRIALWWAVYIISVFTGFGLIQTIIGRSQGGIAASILAITFLLGITGGVVALLRREIRVQRHMLRQSGPDGEALLSESAVSTRHVRKVAVICAVVALGLGLTIAITPPTTSSGSGTTSAP